MASKTCADCKFSFNDPNYDDLQCRRYPPIENNSRVFVSPTYWCGEFVSVVPFPDYDINDRKSIWV